MSILSKKSPAKNQGFALVLVLCFIALLAIVVLAFFSNSALQRTVSDGSASQIKTDLFALGAVDTIVGDLKQEIVAGSTGITNTGTGYTNTLYYPSANITAVPAISGFTTNVGLENLVKISGTTNFHPISSSDTAYTNLATYSVPNRATTNSSTNVSLNGRSISPTRWNKPMLIARDPGIVGIAASNTVTTPTPNFTAAIPNWIMVTRTGANPTTWTNSMQWSTTNPNTVVGRYAYAIYNEGGLLDANVAGYQVTNGSSTNLNAHIPYKNAEAFADLTQLTNASGQLLAASNIATLLNWRNAASLTTNGSPDPTGGTYVNYVLSNLTGFLHPSSTNITAAGQSDSMFASRQQLLDFFKNRLGSSTAPFPIDTLPYLSTFTRGLDQPSYIPAVQTNPNSAPVVLTQGLGGNTFSFPPYFAGAGDKLVNPSFLTARVQTSFTRNDGTTAQVGDPLVNKRFPLQRLAWITYKGASYDLYNKNPSDPTLLALMSNGVTASYLQQGTTNNIAKYFGLTWDPKINHWVYSNHRGTTPSGGRIIMFVGRPTGTPVNANEYVEDVNNPPQNPTREPDFFELLKAGISVGSLGKVAATSTNTVTVPPPAYKLNEVPANFRYSFDSSVDYHVIQIGANILNEVNPTSIPIRIAYDDGSHGLWEFQGVTDLPYLSYVFNGVLRTTNSAPQPSYGGGSTIDGSSPGQYHKPQTGVLTQPGNAYVIQVPAVWNPYDPNGTVGSNRPTKFQVVVTCSDPISIANNSQPNQVWCAGQATSQSNAGGDNSGLVCPSDVYSYGATGSGKTATSTGMSTDTVTFTDANGTLCREPTLIFQAGGTMGVRRTGSSGGITGNINTSLDANPFPNEPTAFTGPWAPLVLGNFPLAFANAPNSVVFPGAGMIGTVGTALSDNRVYFTYQLQYSDPSSGAWVTYDTKYGRTTCGLVPFMSVGGNAPSVTIGPDARFSPNSWAAAIDPRSARFGLIMDTENAGRSGMYAAEPPPQESGWIFDTNGVTTLGITYPIRSGTAGGFFFVNQDANNIVSGNVTGNNGLLNNLANYARTQDIPYPSYAAGWSAPIAFIKQGNSANVMIFAPGMYAQNNPAAPFDGTSTQPSYYADADGVVRRAAGAYVPAGAGGSPSASTPVGLSPASIQGYSGAPTNLITPATNAPFSQSQSRPLLLHRPFRTVAELGYVFRDLPWKNLDFFTPESGDAALLDLFCINENSNPNGLVAGKVDLNTRQTNVLAAIISGAYVDDPKITDTTVGSLSTTLSSAIAAALITRTADTNNYGPFQNLSELVGKWKTNAPIAPGINYSLSSGSYGVDLGAPYIDGSSSYVGFSGATTTNGVVSTNTTTPKNLTDVFGNPANFSGTYATSIQTSMSQIQRFREAPIRALSAVGQTRVWNLMIDVVAQTGRYPQSAANAPNPLNAFLVEGEQRYWIHIAIDRMTGQVIDRQVEVVKE